MKITITRTKNNLEYNYADDLTKINLSSKLTIFVKKLEKKKPEVIIVKL